MLRRIFQALIVLVSATYMGCPTSSGTTVIPYQPGNPTFYNLNAIINCLVDSESDRICWEADSPAT